jgi:hypothetical protein
MENWFFACYYDDLTAFLAKAVCNKREEMFKLKLPSFLFKREFKNRKRLGQKKKLLKRLSGQIRIG